MKSVIKISAAGATIFAIGVAMVVLQPTVEEPVAQADADIAAFNFAPKSQQQRFVDTLREQGMERPRAYDHNGNKMFFSTATTKESPRQVLERFQRGFVENGVNESVHLSPAFPDFDSNGFLQAYDKKNKVELTRLAKENQLRTSHLNDYIGGVVPMMVGDDHVVMAGASTQNQSDNFVEWYNEIDENRKERPKGATADPTFGVNAMRFVEAFREGSSTRVLAIWSDEDYQAGKIVDRGEDLNVDPELPSCPGCKRLYNVTGETEVDYSTAAYASGGHTVEDIAAFYDRVLRQKGWELSDTAKVMDTFERTGIKPRTDGKMVQYARGGDFLTLVAWPTDRGAQVHLARSN